MMSLCPNEEDFADYIEGRLSKEKRFALEDHFSGCGNCMDELMLDGNLMCGKSRSESVTVPDRVTHHALGLVKKQSPSFSDSLFVKIRRMLKDFFAYASNYLNLIICLEPQLAVIRGSRKALDRNLIRIAKKYKAVEVGIEIEKINETSVHIRVKKTDPKGLEKSVRVTLSRNEKDLYSYLIGGEEEILFEYIPYGHYALVFSQNGKKIGIFPFEIKETSHGRG
jgi:hypothetical protein